ncbi:alpha-L-fucosidase, partial [Flavobacterium sp.]|uniref:alpha-L-fucosidase n=1 Tax=Flavobacterium sp. TaxID=239 RepID=UPI003264F568
MRTKILFTLLSLLQFSIYSQDKNPMPVVAAPLAINSFQMGDSKTFSEVKLQLPIAKGPFEPTWESIEKNYPGEPAWLRDAKFGIWVHFGP